MHYRWMTFPLMGLLGFAQAAPLTFNAALDLAERDSPSLSAQSATMAAAKSSAVAAGKLPDPKLFFGVDNLPVNGPDSWSTSRDFMTMQKIGLMQDVPNSEKRRAQKLEAAAGIDEARGRRNIELIRVRRDTALAWINRYYVEQRLALFDELDRENRTLLEAVRAQIASNRSQPVDIIAPKQEAAQLADRRDDFVRDLAKARAELGRLIGHEADEPLAGEPPQLDIDPDRLHRHLHHHPDLAIFDSLTRKAQAEEREAEATKESDWGVAVAYQKRGPLYSDMVSVQFTFDLPIFPETRQDPRIAAKKEEIARISDEKAAMLRNHIAELENDLADYAATSRQLDRMKNTWLPLSREKYDLRLGSYRAGKGEIEEVVNARNEWIEQRLKAIDLENRKEQAAAKLRFAYGEDMQ